MQILLTFENGIKIESKSVELIDKVANFEENIEFQHSLKINKSNTTPHKLQYEKDIM